MSIDRRIGANFFSAGYTGSLGRHLLDQPLGIGQRRPQPVALGQLLGKIDQPAALANAQVPLRDFMIGQILKNRNEEDVFLFTEFAHEKPSQWKDVKTLTLVPAFMLSELKTAFLLGFKVYLPFLIIDMVISTVLISMGMMMLPPVLISLPFKLLLFVLVDGWRLITGGLMCSFLT